MMNKKVKILGACVLTLAVALSGMALPQAYAAKAVDPSKTCSIEFNLANSKYPEGETNPEDKTPTFAEELEKADITVNLYKVANIKETGDYEVVGGFETLDLSRINGEAAAATWAERAADAKELLAEDAEPDATVTLENGTGKATGLATGMYLIVAEEVKSPYFTYTFKENLISLPNNYYDSTKDDAWIYDLTGKNAVGLKPDREERKGDLVINKALTSYNATVGGATFVFHVSVKKLDGTVTTNVYKMAFNGAGSDALTIPELPAGAKVTVTEVYSGASYKLISANDQKTTIIAKEEEGAPVSVSFTNAYNGGQNGGSGVVNHFYKDGETVNWKNDLNAGRGEE